MNRIQVPLVAAMLGAAAISLVGCGGGGSGTLDQLLGNSVAGGNTVTGGNTNQSQVSNVVVSPSLGKFSAGAHVNIKNASGTNVGTADTTSDGTATVSIGSYIGPIVIEVTGGTNVTYYDEGTKSSSPFGAAAVLRAIAPYASAALGVTAATNASVEAIKSANAGSIPAAISTDAINTSNNKIAVALGIADVLQAPKLVDASTLASAPLDVGTAADKYALQLAALAQLASTGKTALDVAVDIAKDLQDGILDGKFTPATGPVVPNAATTYTEATVVADIAAKVVLAATDLGTANTKTVVTNDPTVAGTVTTNVTSVGAASPAMVLAKNLFSELRTTLSSLANSSKTGFLNNQAARIDADMKATVAPESAKLFNRLDVIGSGMSVYDAAQTTIDGTNSTFIGTVSFPGETAASAWIKKSGNINNVLLQVGGFTYCYIPSTSVATSNVTCFHAGSDSADFSTTPTKIKFIKYVLVPTGNNNFTYTADRENRTWTGSLSTTGTAPSGVPGGTGTITRTYASGNLTGFNLTGSLPPSAASAPGTVATGVDTLALSATKTALTANNFRYALSGSVNTISTATTPRLVTFLFDSGSYIDVDETNAGNATGNQLLAFNLVGTAKTDATKVVGTLTMSGLTKDKSGTNTIASNLVLSGVMSDISTGGAGDILSGKLEAAITGYGNYNIKLPTVGNNYINGTATFTGTIQAPSRPLMKLVISGTNTGAQAGDVTLNYSYGTISITGTGAASPASGAHFSITNQDGIQIAADPNVANQQLITKAGVTLATVSKNNVINYADGTSETLN